MLARQQTFQSAWTQAWRGRKTRFGHWRPRLDWDPVWSRRYLYLVRAPFSSISRPTCSVARLMICFAGEPNWWQSSALQRQQLLCWVHVCSAPSKGPGSIELQMRRLCVVAHHLACTATIRTRQEERYSKPPNKARPAQPLDFHFAYCRPERSIAPTLSIPTGVAQARMGFFPPLDCSLHCPGKVHATWTHVFFEGSQFAWK